MKALILVGGFGTRLRPLTLTCPKPLVPFCNQAIVLHQIEALVKVGVKEIILAVSEKADIMEKFTKECETKYQIKITFSKEDSPLGTAGPLKLAEELLTVDNSPFFMFNSDVICEYPLEEFLNFHKTHGGEGSIMVTEVKDPSKYGVVVSDEKSNIQSFVEKPTEFVSNKINAGIYLLEPAILNRIEKNKPTSIEREVFPHVVVDKKLFSFVLPGYWMDIGQPKDYLTGTCLHLASMRHHSPELLAKGDNIKGNVLVHPTATVSKTALIGPDVVVGPNVIIEDGARVKRSALFDNVRVKTSAYINSTIVGWDSTIGAWAHVSDCSFGQDVQIGDEKTVYETIVCHHKGVNEDIRAPKIVL